MSDKHTLIAFLSTLASVVVLTLVGAYLAVNKQSSEALGIGAAVTGLIGVIGTFKPRSNPPDNQDVTVTNTKTDPIPTEDQTK